jgi:NAD(P)-dependent dehydrogenase (short-subunit alcohol dehydrogenase family)
MTDRLLGKVCIITGSGGGIGREAAVTFAREGALVVGCRLYVDDAEAPLVAERIGLKAKVEPRVTSPEMRLFGQATRSPF